MKTVIKINIRFVIIILLGLLYIPNVTAQVVIQDTSHFDDDPYNLNSIAGNGKIDVSVGNSGNIFTSLNGKKWVKSNFVAKHDLNFVIWIKNKFIAIGKNGELITSNDGLVWSENNINTHDDLLKMVYINNTYIIITNNSYLNTYFAAYTSKDAINWSTVDMKLYDNYDNLKDQELNINDILFYNHRYIAIFQNNSNINSKTYIGSSTNLKNWDCQLQQHKMYSLSTNGKVLVAAGEIIETTNDGVKWKNVKDLKGIFGKSFNTYCSYIRWVKNKFIAVGLGEDDNDYLYNAFCLTSLNSSNWKLTKSDYSMSSTGYVRITGFDSNKNDLLFTVKQSDNTHITTGWVFKFNNNGISMISDDDNIVKLCLQPDDYVAQSHFGYNDILYNGKYFISVGDEEHITIINN